MKLVAISDTHNLHEKVIIPECDILIHAGDWTSMGYYWEVSAFAKWLNKQPAKYIVITPGNHEVTFEKELPLSKTWILDNCPRAHILIDNLVEIEGLKIYGSPYTPFFNNWAFNLYPGEELIRKWNQIPEGMDVIITHGPVHGILDELARVDGTPSGHHVGSIDLFNRLQVLKPRVHICGHIHTHGGSFKVFNGTSYYNVSICDEMYMTTNPITVIEL